MNQQRDLWIRARIPRLCIAVFTAAFVASAVVWADTDASGDELKLAIILSRHGVRTPLLSDEAMARFAAQPWPKWETPPGIQTPHGNQLIALMGDYYRERLIREGALSGDPETDGPRVFVRADNDQRTIETANILGKALVRAGDSEVHTVPERTADPLFRSFAAHVGNPDASLAVASVLGRTGGDLRNLERAYARQLEELKVVLYGPGGLPGPDSAFSAPSAIATGRKSYLLDFTGPFMVSLNATDALLLQYVDAKPLPEVGWGRVDEKLLTDILALHALFFDLTERTRYPAQVDGSNLASHIIDTLEQAATGDPVPGALGPTGERVVVLVGHDTNIANIGGLFGMNWCVSGAQMNPVLPGGALILELWRHAGKDGSFYVRSSYVAQTLDQMREATPLSLEHPPARSPIFVPGCSGDGPDYDASLASFVRQARRVIDPAFIAPEP